MCEGNLRDALSGTQARNHPELLGKQVHESRTTQSVLHTIVMGASYISAQNQQTWLWALYMHMLLCHRVAAVTGTVRSAQVWHITRGEKRA